MFYFRLTILGIYAIDPDFVRKKILKSKSALTSTFAIGEKLDININEREQKLADKNNNNNYKKPGETIINYRIIIQWYQDNIVINDRLGIEETEKRKQKKTK